MKQKAFSAVVFLSLFMMISCSDGRLVLQEAGMNTLKEFSEKRSEKTLWTKEIDADILSKNISKLDGVKSDIELSPETVSVLLPKNNVYSSLDNLGLLDTRNILPEVFSSVKEFVGAVSLKKDCSNFFETKSLYSYVFFIADLTEIWQDCFKKDFQKETKLFSSSEYASPFIVDNVYEIPVRLYNDYGFVDVCIYYDSTENKITMIEILTYGAKSAG